MITAKNKKDLERTQQNFAKLVFYGKYATYQTALINLGLYYLKERRKKLIWAFAKTSIAYGNFRGLTEPTQKFQKLAHYYNAETVK